MSAGYARVEGAEEAQRPFFEVQDDVVHVAELRCSGTEYPKPAQVVLDGYPKPGEVNQVGG